MPKLRKKKSESNQPRPTPKVVPVEYLGIDTETTGVDLKHGARPFMVTTYDGRENQTWLWEVDPKTRQVQYDRQDMEDILHLIFNAQEVRLQNSLFDAAMLEEAYRDIGIEIEWPWRTTWDSLLESHLLHSSAPHDLTSLGIQYLGIDVTKYDRRCEKIVKSIRSAIQRGDERMQDWRIAKKGLREMPSANEKVWKNDLWLIPEAARRGYDDVFPDGEECSDEALYDYADSDSAVTWHLAEPMQKRTRRRRLKDISLFRHKLLPVVHGMQQRGVHLNSKRLTEQHKEYSESVEELAEECCSIAESYGHELELPKSGMNNNLREFVWEVMQLPVLKRTKRTKTGGGNPSMDKDVVEEYLLTLEPGTREERFVKSLSAKRKRDTAVNYMEAYKRFWRKAAGPPSQFLLFPRLNPTGTNTLRFGSNNPNSQNISKKEDFNLRYSFGPAPGREWWSCDARNIELRIPAYESGEQELIGLFERPNEAPYYGSNHLLNFSTVYPDIWEQELQEVGLEAVGPHCKKKYASTWYQRCKNGGFAVQYGAVERTDRRGTADRAFGRDGCHRKLKQRFARLEGLNNKYVRMAEEYGYVETMPDKSVDPDRGYPLFCAYGTSDIKPTVPLNYHVQGTAMWWMCQAMIRCQALLDRWREEEGYEGFIVLQVHDELVFDLPADSDPINHTDNLPRIEALCNEMSRCGEDIGVPTPVGAEYHSSNWSEGETVI